MQEQVFNVAEFERVQSGHYICIKTLDKTKAGYVRLPKRGIEDAALHFEGIVVEVFVIKEREGFSVFDALTGSGIGGNDTKLNALETALRFLFDLGVERFRAGQKKHIQQFGVSPAFSVPCEESEEKGICTATSDCTFKTKKKA